MAAINDFLDDLRYDYFIDEDGRLRNELFEEYLIQKYKEELDTKDFSQYLEDRNFLIL